MLTKKYLNIKEVSEILGIKEHVIRYWDSIDPKTNKLRVEGISTKSKGGTRFFNRDNITKLKKLKNLLYEDGHQNYSLALANRFINKRKTKLKNDENIDVSSHIQNSQNIRQILKNMRLLIK